MAVLHNYPAIATVVLNWKTGISKEPSLPPVSWDALKRGAVKLKRMQSEDPTCSITCNPLSEYNMGGLHLVRILEFNDNTRWIVSIQLHECNSESIKRLLHEVHTLALIRERTCIPVPQVFGYEPSHANIELTDRQVEMASKRFPKIGMIVKHEDGTYDIDPIPGLGGPFERASRMVGY
ncbi:uncharacterized protein PADG_11270 [Paracoccidioides brasiliensis Pb18]|uniref:Aminoglycoside phosphotransferase domain-containing protein n=2 Tax=Paracoccidioides brasiliensis TaxID=121759 RepID=A0A0A0HVP4_PARBD|nr:uncharacterized protein PADG_11270 [Paracoccidioides brasiliensis Pb18]KGM92453.1 hypothetical protein PADG_11270 [Paracoccidioides brasiliensis Pb18]ODH35407.1 hypothetical protein ACO22_02931 [Paracoccidioides brasiliensis]